MYIYTHLCYIVVRLLATSEQIFTAFLVVNLMVEIMDSFGRNWQEEQQKQRMLAVRFKAQRWQRPNRVPQQ